MKAYQLIDSPEKWVNHNPEGEEGKNCAMTAICRAYNNAESYLMEYKLKSHLCVPYISAWNDNSDWETVYNTLKELDI